MSKGLRIRGSKRPLKVCSPNKGQLWGQTKLLSAWSSQSLKPPKDRGGPASCSDLCRCLADLTGKQLFLAPSLKLSRVNLCPFSLSLPLCSYEETRRPLPSPQGHPVGAVGLLSTLKLSLLQADPASLHRADAPAPPPWAPSTDLYKPSSLPMSVFAGVQKQIR